MLASLTHLKGERRSPAFSVSLCLVLGYGASKGWERHSGFTRHHGQNWEVLPRWGILPR
jgi:hypothetical protein